MRAQRKKKILAVNFFVIKRPKHSEKKRKEKKINQPTKKNYGTSVAIISQR
jgi:hypothetical protein